MRALLLAVLGVLAGGPVYAQPPAPTASLDLVVSAAAERGRSLTPADFEVRASGDLLPVEQVRLVQPSGDRTPLPPIDTDAAEQKAAAAANRLVAVYIDEYHLTQDSALEAAKRAVASLLRTALGPRDLVVVLKPLDSVVAIRLSTDREGAASRVEAAEGREGDYTARSALEQNLVAGTPGRADATRRQIVLAGLSALAAHLGRFDGRKTLIVLSNGFARQDGRGRAQASVDSVIRAANIGAVAIYPVRPAAAGTGADPDAMVRLAQETTGFVVDGAAVLGRGLPRVLDDASRYYLLTVALPPGQERAGFRAVDVVVRRQGLDARVRGGIAVRASDDDVPVAPVRGLPEGLRVPRHTSLLIRTWFGFSPSGDGRTRVQVVWEPVPWRAGERGSAARPTRIMLRASTMEGQEVFTGEATASLGEVAPDPVSRSQLAFETPPARLLVQIDVLDLTGRVLDRDVRDLSVPAFEGAVALGTASVFRARTGRDLRLLADADDGVSPVAARQFSRAEHLVVRLPLAATAGTRVTARLMNAFGRPLRSLPTTDTRRGLVQVELPLAPLASATYVLEFTATADARTAIERVEFTVTP
ncbi:MAG: hypothetical protein U0Q55_05220 [Vicinamibacterales bacterium]